MSVSLGNKQYLIKLCRRISDYATGLPIWESTWTDISEYYVDVISDYTEDIDQTFTGRLEQASVTLKFNNFTGAFNPEGSPGSLWDGENEFMYHSRIKYWEWVDSEGTISDDEDPPFQPIMNGLIADPPTYGSNNTCSIVVNSRLDILRDHYLLTDAVGRVTTASSQAIMGYIIDLYKNTYAELGVITTGGVFRNDIIYDGILTYSENLLEHMYTIIEQGGGIGGISGDYLFFTFWGNTAGTRSDFSYKGYTIEEVYFDGDLYTDSISGSHCVGFNNSVESSIFLFTPDEELVATVPYPDGFSTAGFIAYDSTNKMLLWCNDRDVSVYIYSATKNKLIFVKSNSIFNSDTIRIKFDLDSGMFFTSDATGHIYACSIDSDTYEITKEAEYIADSGITDFDLQYNYGNCLILFGEGVGGTDNLKMVVYSYSENTFTLTATAALGAEPSAVILDGVVAYVLAGSVIAYAYTGSALTLKATSTITTYQTLLFDYNKHLCYLTYSGHMLDTLGYNNDTDFLTFNSTDMGGDYWYNSTCLLMDGYIYTISRSGTSHSPSASISGSASSSPSTSVSSSPSVSASSSPSSSPSASISGSASSSASGSPSSSVSSSISSSPSASISGSISSSPSASVSASPSSSPSFSPSPSGSQLDTISDNTTLLAKIDHYYRFENDADDSVGSVDATYIDATYTSSGIIDGCYDFDDGIFFPTGATFPSVGTNELTFAALLKHTETATIRRIYSTRLIDYMHSSDGTEIYLNNGTMYFIKALPGSVYEYISCSWNPDIDETYSLVCRASDSLGMEIWINGVRQAYDAAKNTNFVAGSTSGYDSIGVLHRYPTNKYPFKGLIDEVLISADAITDAEIAYYHNSGYYRRFV